MLWANFLHFYQPPTQKPFWVNKIAAEAYRPIVKGLKKRPRTKLTLNASGVLLELLDACGNEDVIKDLRELLESGQIELTGSAKFHPLLPFLPKDEVVRQIKLNEETLKKYFGNYWQPRGFFPPEMAFDETVGEIAKELGYQWVIADELSFPADQRPIDYSRLYTIRGLGDFHIYFRERKMSWVILSGQVGTGRLLMQSLGNRLHKKEYLLTAMDGETFGHHRPGLEQLLFEIYENEKIENVLISDLPKYFPEARPVEPAPSTWALMEKDLEQKKPFSRWRDSDNAIHEMQWELTNLAIESLRMADKNSPGYNEARDALDRALHSDQYWWASAKPWWSMEMIERGAKELSDAVVKTPGISQKKKDKASDLYRSIIFTAFDWQRSGVIDDLARQEDEDIRQRMDQGLPMLPKDEIEKMIKKLKEEMAAVAKKEEFERAAQIRDRIAELRRYEADVVKPNFLSEGDREWG
ncbi:MAG: UvrB/UvrC motif-containing protein [Candidatus Portnoybacteria bacterium]|nr:UvrB/UvrC motif-containing protein [Candidatus Portnoybacteria bacterium]